MYVLYSTDDTLVNHADGAWGQLLVNDGSRTRNNTSYTRLEDFLQTLFLSSEISALQDLVALMSEPKPDLEGPVGPREKTTLLLIIAALAKLARVPVERPSAAATAIEGEAARMGIRLGLRTIEEKLKLIRDILRARPDT